MQKGVRVRSQTSESPFRAHLRRNIQDEMERSGRQASVPEDLRPVVDVRPIRADPADAATLNTKRFAPPEWERGKKPCKDRMLDAYCQRVSAVEESGHQKGSRQDKCEGAEHFCIWNLPAEGRSEPCGAIQLTKRFSPIAPWTP